MDGGTFAGSSLAGKPAVLWFWAAWCTRCRAVAGEVAARGSGRASAAGRSRTTPGAAAGPDLRPPKLWFAY
ncbi:hypothetical protein [Micromonospora chersina]